MDKLAHIIIIAVQSKGRYAFTVTARFQIMQLETLTNLRDCSFNLPVIKPANQNFLVHF